MFFCCCKPDKKAETKNVRVAEAFHSCRSYMYLAVCQKWCRSFGCQVRVFMKIGRFGQGVLHWKQISNGMLTVDSCWVILHSTQMMLDDLMTFANGFHDTSSINSHHVWPDFHWFPNSLYDFPYNFMQAMGSRAAPVASWPRGVPGLPSSFMINTYAGAQRGNLQDSKLTSTNIPELHMSDPVESNMTVRLFWCWTD